MIKVKEVGCHQCHCALCPAQASAGSEPAPPPREEARHLEARGSSCRSVLARASAQSPEFSRALPGGATAKAARSTGAEAGASPGEGPCSAGGCFFPALRRQSGVRRVGRLAAGHCPRRAAGTPGDPGRERAGFLCKAPSDKRPGQAAARPGMRTPVPGKAPLNSCSAAASRGASPRAAGWGVGGTWQPVSWGGALHPDLQVEGPPGERWETEIVRCWVRHLLCTPAPRFYPRHPIESCQDWDLSAETGLSPEHRQVGPTPTKEKEKEN